jgi:hypothetical protein
MNAVSRRGFLGIVSAVAIVPPDLKRTNAGEPRYAATVHEAFPRQDPARAKEIVGVSHGNVVRVKELVSASPALARASWDWGYGDWETALGAASHVGNREIAAVLLAAGAHPTIFSAAMLGQLEAVKAFVAASPGVQRTRGPHGISLLDHARAGESIEVVKYLESLGDAPPRYPNEPLSEDDVAGLLGTYTFGPHRTEQLIMSKNARGVLVVKREGEPERNLFHHGDRVFNPAGAEAVRIRFTPKSGRATTLSVVDGPLRVEAGR